MNTILDAQSEDDSGPLPTEDELTVLIDYQKYLQYQANQSLRVEKQVQADEPPPPDFGRPSFDEPHFDHPDDHHHPNPPYHPPPPQPHPQQPSHPFNKTQCLDSVNEVYQECGSKCVLGCRYSSSASVFTAGKHECDKNDCVEGCFCKTGLVRHQSKCIPALECPIRKCHHRDEVYVSNIT